MTELWSDDEEKTQLPEGMDGDYQITADGGGVLSQQASGPTAYRTRYDSTSLESSPHNSLKSRFDDDAPVTPRQSSGPPVPSPAPVFDPRDHPYVPPDQKTLRSPPPPQPEKGIARRSRAPVWEVVSTDRDESQEYYVGLGGAVVKGDPSTGVANLLHRRSSKSNLHPILQNFSSPIGTCPFLCFRCCVLIFVYRRIRCSAQSYHGGRSLDQGQSIIACLVYFINNP